MINIGLYFKGDNVDPDKITEVLGVQPSAAQKKGQIKSSKSAEEVVAQTGAWSLVSESQIKSNVFDDHIKFFKAALGENKDRVARLPYVEFAFFDVFIAFNTEEGDESTFGFEISSENLKFLNECSIPVYFTTYT